MKNHPTFFSLIVLVTFSSNIWAELEQRLEYRANTDQCALLQALNGSGATPQYCQDNDDSKSAFSPAIPPHTIELQGLNFDTNSSRLNKASRKSLLGLAKAMQSPSSREQIYSIDGHTDRRGNPGTNLMLATKRALAVRQFLVSQGVPSSQLHARAFGATQLKNSQQPDALVNRRVEVANIGRNNGK